VHLHHSPASAVTVCVIPARSLTVWNHLPACVRCLPFVLRFRSAIATVTWVCCRSPPAVRDYRSAGGRYAVALPLLVLPFTAFCVTCRCLPFCHLPFSPSLSAVTATACHICVGSTSLLQIACVTVSTCSTRSAVSFSAALPAFTTALGVFPGLLFPACHLHLHHLPLVHTCLPVCLVLPPFCHWICTCLPPAIVSGSWSCLLPLPACRILPGLGSACRSGFCTACLGLGSGFTVPAGFYLPGFLPACLPACLVGFWVSAVSCLLPACHQVPAGSLPFRRSATVLPAVFVLRVSFTVRLLPFLPPAVLPACRFAHIWVWVLPLRSPFYLLPLPPPFCHTTTVLEVLVLDTFLPACLPPATLTGLPLHLQISTTCLGARSPSATTTLVLGCVRLLPRYVLPPADYCRLPHHLRILPLPATVTVRLPPAVFYLRVPPFRVLPDSGSAVLPLPFYRFWFVYCTCHRSATSLPFTATVTTVYRCAGFLRFRCSVSFYHRSLPFLPGGFPAFSRRCLRFTTGADYLRSGFVLPPFRFLPAVRSGCRNGAVSYRYLHVSCHACLPLPLHAVRYVPFCQTPPATVPGSLPFIPQITCRLPAFCVFL